MFRNNRIVDLTFYEAESPVSIPIADATHSISRISFIIGEIRLESGVTGQGYMLVFDFQPAALKGMLVDLKHFVLNGYDVDEFKRVRQEWDAATEYLGMVGLLRWGHALLNIAMWDAWGKTLGQPVHLLLGGSDRAVDVYGSGGWLSYSLDELITEITTYRKRGFRAAKMKVGAPEIESDVERIRKVREAVGPDFDIMIDANQGMTVDSALQLIKAVEDQKIRWFEEPLDHYDYQGYAALRQNTSVLLAMGEREYTIEGLKKLIDLNALDLWQPDIVRLGGVEGWLESAAYAEARHIPVLPHYYKDYDVPLMTTVDKPFGVESFDWIDSLIDTPLEIIDGKAHPRMGEGWGFQFNKEMLTEIV